MQGAPHGGMTVAALAAAIGMPLPRAGTPARYQRTVTDAAERIDAAEAKRARRAAKRRAQSDGQKARG